MKVLQVPAIIVAHICGGMGGDKIVNGSVTGASHNRRAYLWWDGWGEDSQ